MKDKYKVVEENYNHIDISFHDSYDTTAEFAGELKRFTQSLSQNAHILNIGGTVVECEYFLKKGFRVDNIDISQAMVDHVAKHSKETRVIKANIKSYKNKNDALYDGTWACRSLIHVPPDDLVAVLGNIRKLLGEHGYFGAVFFSAGSDHVTEEEIPETHSDKDGVSYYRVLYPKDTLMGLYAKTDLGIVHMQNIKDLDGDKGWFILADGKA